MGKDVLLRGHPVPPGRVGAAPAGADRSLAGGMSPCYVADDLWPPEATPPAMPARAPCPTTTPPGQRIGTRVLPEERLHASDRSTAFPPLGITGLSDLDAHCAQTSEDSRLVGLRPRGRYRPGPQAALTPEVVTGRRGLGERL